MGERFALRVPAAIQSPCRLPKLRAGRPRFGVKADRKLSGCTHILHGLNPIKHQIHQNLLQSTLSRAGARMAGG